MANYDANGHIVNVVALGTISGRCGFSLYDLFVANGVEITIRTQGGIEHDEPVNLLDLLGNNASLKVTDTFLGETITLWEVENFSKESITQDKIQGTHLYDLPSNLAPNSDVNRTFEFTSWQYNNTELGTTPNMSFTITVLCKKQMVVLSGELTSITPKTDSANFNVVDYYNNPSDNSGSIRKYIGNFEIETNLGDYQLWDLLQLGFTMTPLSGATPSHTFSGNTTAIESAALNYYFQHCDTQLGGATEIEFTFNYFDSANNVERSATITTSLFLVGIIYFALSFLNDNNTYIEQPLPKLYILQNISNSLGNFYQDNLFKQYSDLYRGMTIHITNTNTSQTYTENDDLPNGVYSVSVDLFVNPNYTISSSAITLKLYDTTITNINARSIKQNYRVGSKFSDSDLIVNARHLIYGTEYYSERIYYPNFSSNYNNHVFVSGDIPSVRIVVSYLTFTANVTLNVYALSTDNVYVYNKKTQLGSNYGELQQGFNMNFVLDETKDNAKITIFNRIKEDIKPFTIVRLESTDTWWIVKKDNVTRYDSEDTPLYQHDINLLGAIEILNARDLTNCGFNVDHYTIGSFLTRLMKLTDFEIPIEFDYGTYIDERKNVDFLKTFENYTPLSAIKELCNAYNVKAEMTFVTNTYNRITKAIISFVPNSGINEEPIDIETFDDSQEKLSSDKDNYGSRVISNVQNCTSGKVIRYPSKGTIHIGSRENKVTYDTALLRLPSKAKEVKSLEICGKYQIVVDILNTTTDNEVTYGVRSNSDCHNDSDRNATIDSFIDFIDSGSIGAMEDIKQDIVDYLTNNKDFFSAFVENNGSVTLENGANYDSDTETWNGKQIELAFRGNISSQLDGHPGIGYSRDNSIGLNEKKYFDTFPSQPCLIYWEQGSDLIRNFKFYDYFTSSQSSYTYPIDDLEVIPNIVFTSGEYEFRIGVKIGSNQYNECGFNLVDLFEATYVVYYVPQNDLKIKVENGLLDNDSNLYNQNGTLVSSKAVSKLINSHALSISSNQVTRYKRYYDFFAIPKIGQIIDNNGEKYIVNNVSIDFAENDNNVYAMDCIFTLTKQIACKSAMINANSIIRDYPTPQNNNIVRTQCYRDYIVLDYTFYNHETLYLSQEKSLAFLNDVLEYGNYVGYGNSHTAIIKVDFGDNTYYYQLPSIRYDLDKMMVEVVDFKDNNIIGYANQSTNHPFQFTSWWVLNDLINVPISYVDSVGHLDSIILLLANNEQLTSAYDYVISQHQELDDISSLYSASCLIPQELYDKVNEDKDFVIAERAYDKDGLEIPVFQYSCQIDTRNNIVVSSDLFNYYQCFSFEMYVYGYKVIDNEVTEESVGLYFDNTDLPSLSESNVLFKSRYVDFLVDGWKIDINFYDSVSKNFNTNTENKVPSYGLETEGKTIIIYRNKVSFIELAGTPIVNIGKCEFVMALNKCKVEQESGSLSIYANTYKLK